MRTTTHAGLTVWDSSTDAFSHTALAANWDAIDARLGGVDSLGGTTFFSLVTSLPGSPSLGQCCMVTVPTGGFAAYTIVRWDGTNWRAVGPFEILPSVPTLGNYPGRIIILSATSGGFSAWSVIRYDGTQWAIVGGFSNVNTGGNPNNIVGLQTSGDVYYSVGTRGPVLTDRNSGTAYRLFMLNGKLESEVVS